MMKKRYKASSSTSVQGFKADNYSHRREYQNAYFGGRRAGQSHAIANATGKSAVLRADGIKFPVAKSSGDVHFGKSPSPSGRRPGAQPGNTNASKNHAPQNASGKTYSDARSNQTRTGNRYPGSLSPSNFGRARPFPFKKK